MAPAGMQPAPRLRPVIHLDLGAKVRTTAVLAAGSSRPRRAGVFLSAIDGRTPSSEASSSPTRLA
ncbi:hypothetical protein [Streptomyces sp. IGB124]|uniref:hypothetical protein n=1 Tax=Streptomyces sp. IGB124 TaxID=1519485 RepID=UPI000A469698|nr:hypothetical protein [Streptomyces sp. IGB124]